MGPDGGELLGGARRAVSPGIDQLEYVSCTAFSFNICLGVRFLQER